MHILSIVHFRKRDLEENGHITTLWAVLYKRRGSHLEPSEYCGTYILVLTTGYIYQRFEIQFSQK